MEARNEVDLVALWDVERATKPIELEKHEHED
jgi:hypothetical protein